MLDLFFYAPSRRRRFMILLRKLWLENQHGRVEAIPLGEGLGYTRNQTLVVVGWLGEKGWIEVKDISDGYIVKLTRKGLLHAEVLLLPGWQQAVLMLAKFIPGAFGFLAQRFVGK